MNHLRLIWYCRKCRKVLKCEPKWAVKKACRCKVPELPFHGPTRVWVP